MIRNTAAFVLLTVCVFCGCQGSQESVGRDTSSGAGGSPQNSAESSSRRDPALSEAEAPPPQTVNVVGCLEGSEIATPRGSDGAAAPAGASASRYRLTRARAESSESAGVGTSGAGASGGPLVAGVSDFELDGLPPNGAAAVHKQVRITGRVEAAPSRTSPSANAEVPALQQAQPDGTTGRSRTAGAPGDPVRRLAVESVQVVSQTCEQLP